jgi:hypothetical protein
VNENNETAQEVEAPGRSDEITMEDVAAHFGVEKLASYCSAWPNNGEQLQRLSQLPEFVKKNADKTVRVTFDYDPEYPRMLLQATVTDLSRSCQ